MSLMTQHDQPEHDDQWDGGDVEPVFHPRKTDRNRQDEIPQTYADSYFEGDKFS
jgi:hypothetical protein